MSDEKKLTLAPRAPLGAPLGIKKTVDAGKVRQSFSHGRTKQVVVEVKKRTVLGRPAEKELPPVIEPIAPPPPAPSEAAPASPMAELMQAALAETAPAPVPVVAPAPAPAPVIKPVAAPPAKPKPAPAPVAAVGRKAEAAASARRGPVRPNYADDDEDTSGMSKQELLQLQLRRAEDDRRRMQEEQRKREDQARASQIEQERNNRDANKKSASESAAGDIEIINTTAPRPAGKPAPRGVTASTGAPVLPPVEKEGERRKIDDKTRVRVAGADDDEESRARAGVAGVKRRPEPAKPVRTRTDDRRQAGKLTVARALDDDAGQRVRSLAALKRAREKERRALGQQGPAAKQFREVVVPESITVQELANRMAERGGDVIKALFRMGVVATLSQSIDQDTAELIIGEFGHTVKRVLESDIEIGIAGDQDETGDLQIRPPVVTIMGHVDHGKTSLLDALRNTNVVSGEAGGITQHIGAYQITVNNHKITFLDTPGHEAFTAMRARGANITDIVILVVAADDGLMPQTIEAINHTRAAGVPMLVAINKMDKPGAQPKKVREALLQYNVQVEEFGGEVQDVEVSALKRTGLDTLIEKIQLQSEILELRANPDRAAEGTVIEAQLDKGRGPVATVLVRRGTLRVGDIFVIGTEWGKVRALINDQGKQIKVAGPSQPVEILGLSGVPGAGDEFSVVENEARAREVASYRQGIATRKRTTSEPVLIENVFTNLKANRAKEFPLVIKGDVQGSVEAIVNAVNRISTDEIKARILHSGVGAVTESDVTLAAASKAPIISFSVRPNANARVAAEREGVEIQYYTIIYDLVDKIKAAMAGELGPLIIDTVVATITVRDVFQAGKSGKAAGCYVASGVVKRTSKVRLVRDSAVIYTGVLTSLRRFKDDVSEVRTGLECGMTLENCIDMKAGDTIEAFETEERARTL
jgi:translation initiation factor IF-2